jgi:hypothetical protein
MISTLKFTDIKLRSIFFQHLIILGIGVGLFYFERFEIADLFWEKLILVAIAFVKCIYFIEHSFRKIEEASLNDISYNRFIVIILTNILLIVVSFAVDYSCLELIQPESFKGLAQPGTFGDRAFEFSYFSVLSFTTVAFGDILPLTKAARSLTILEVGVAYLTTIIIISNFVQIKDSIGKDGQGKE